MHADNISMILAVTLCRASAIEVRRLAAISRLRNRKREISGCLFWAGEYFVQLLEGTAAELSATLRGMGSDRRQSDPRVLLQMRIETRQFNCSSFGFVPVHDFEEAVGEAYAGTCSVCTLQTLAALLMQEQAEAEPPSPEAGEPG